MSVQTVISRSKTLIAEAGQWLPALSLAALGFALVLAVGFAPVEAVHNAAHDTRHSAAFPCH